MNDNSDGCPSQNKSSFGRVRRESSRYSAPVPSKSEKTATKKPAKKRAAKKKKTNTAEEWDRVVNPIRPFKMMFTKKMQFEADFKSEMDRVAEVAAPILAAQRTVIEKEHEKLKEFMGKLPDGGNVKKGTPLVFEVSGKISKKILLDVGNEPVPPPMTYYEPIEKNVRVPDQPLLSHVPYVSETTDDMAICALMFKQFPEGIHGYLRDHAPVSEYLFFKIMKSALEKTKNPDLFYYAMYRLWPNRGTQQKMSEINRNLCRFPKLCARFAAGENLVHLEPWKKKEEGNRSGTDSNFEFSSIGNFFTYLLPVPTGNHGVSCSENCWIHVPLLDVRKMIQLGKVEDFHEIFLKKDADRGLSESTGFLNALHKSDREKSNFCAVASKFNQRTCAKWYRELLKLVDFPKKEQISSMKIDKPWRDRDQTFRKLWAQLIKDQEKCAGATKKLETVFVVRPCTHFGPCGPGKPDCSCELFCTEQCRCDINCIRRFPGCRCKPGMCRTKSCACFKLSWDCQPGLCTSCGCDEKEKVSCGNFELTLNRQKHVIVKPSEIAGWGAFIMEDVGKHEYIGEYVGEHITEEETERRGHLYHLKTSYIFDLEGDAGSIDATRAGNVFRFVNHSKNPSCEIRKRMTAGRYRLAFYARRNLKSGEELTFDYKYTDSHASKLFDHEPEDRVPKMDEFSCVHENDEYDQPSTSSRKSKIKKNCDADGGKKPKVRASKRATPRMTPPGDQEGSPRSPTPKKAKPKKKEAKQKKISEKIQYIVLSSDEETETKVDNCSYDGFKPPKQTVSESLEESETSPHIRSSPKSKKCAQQLLQKSDESSTESTEEKGWIYVSHASPKVDKRCSQAKAKKCDKKS